MVVIFHLDAQRLQVDRHLSAQVVELVLGRDGVVAAVQRDVVSMAALRAIPVGLLRLEMITGAVGLVLPCYLVEDVKLELWSPVALVSDAGLGQELLGAAGNVARIVGKDCQRAGLVGVADEAKSWRVPERVDDAGRQVWD